MSSPRVLTLAAAASLVVLSLACNSSPRRAGPAPGRSRLRVVTTLFPLYDMARGVGGDRARVTLLLPPGVEAHSFEPKPSDVARIADADVFVYTGRLMEPWVEDVIKGAANKDLVVVDAGRDVKLLPAALHGDDGRAGVMDPHIWLDFDNARMMVRNIAAAFELRDSTNRTLYERRAAEYCARLSEYDSTYRATLTACRRKEIVYGGHFAFGYLAHRYGLVHVAAQGIAPDAEPTARDLARLVEQIRRTGTTYVFYEELASPKIAQTLAAETNARLLLLNAGHNLTRAQFEQGVSYFDILKANLDNLRTGLGCE